jgi:hypothetical protein
MRFIFIFVVTGWTEEYNIHFVFFGPYACIVELIIIVLARLPPKSSSFVKWRLIGLIYLLDHHYCCVNNYWDLNNCLYLYHFWYSTNYCNHYFGDLHHWWYLNNCLYLNKCNRCSLILNFDWIVELSSHSFHSALDFEIRVFGFLSPNSDSIFAFDFFRLFLTSVGFSHGSLVGFGY